MLPCLTLLLNKENPALTSYLNRASLQSKLWSHGGTGLIFTPLYHTHPTPLKFKPENIYFGDLPFSRLDYPKMGWSPEMPDTYIHVLFSWHSSSIYLSKVLLVTQQLSQVFQAPDLLTCLCFDSRPATLGKKPKYSLCCVGNGWLWCGVWQ